MCGFAGLLSTAGFTRPELVDYAVRMAAPLTHRGPDDSGIWADAHAGVAFGFRRLAILDLSGHGHQPMRSPSGRFTMVFNGEVYNFRDLRTELEARGYGFAGQSDTEVMLAAFDEWGIDAAVQRFSGMFALAIWDAERRELSLCRDRLGKKPLYVYSEPGLITFGAELKALVAGPSFDRTIDRTALRLYLRYLYVPGPRTIYARAIKLPPAHILTITDARQPLPPSRAYWSLADVARRGLEHPFEGTDAEAIDAVDALVSDAVRSRLHADVPLGALLSGGVDSSTVVALMQEACTTPVRTHTIGFAEEAYDEARFAAGVARHLGTEHTEWRLTGEDASQLIPRMPDIFDEPFANPCQLPALLVCQLARRHVTVALSGDGGDEVFGGYNRYLYGCGVLAQAHRVPRILRRPAASAIGLVPVAAWDRLSTLVPVLPSRRVGERLHKIGDLLQADSAEDMYRSLVSTWQRPDRLVSGTGLDDDPTRAMLHNGGPTSLLDRMMLADQAVYLPDDALVKMDRASMAVSLELRSPLLDHRLVELSWRLPSALKVRQHTGKWILRQVLYRRVPKALLERPKMGFTVPIDRWLRGPLREWAEDLMLTRGDSHGLIDMSQVTRAWRDLQEGRRAGGLAIWAVLMFHAWRTRWAP